MTLREGVNLLGVTTLDSAIAQPTDPLLAELQKERRLSMIEFSRPGASVRSALAAQRARTDDASAEAVRRARDGKVKWFAGNLLEHRIDEMIGRLRGVDALRRSVDGRTADRTRIAAGYSDVIESIFRVYDSLATLDDKDFAADTRTEVELNRTWELLSQEDALVAGALTAGRFNQAELITFTQTAGTRRHNISAALIAIQDSDGALYDALTKNAKLAQVQSLEDQIMQNRRITTGKPPHTVTRPAVTLDQWSAAATPALSQVRDSIQAGGDRLVDRAKPIAAGVILRLLLAGGLGLLAVIASVVVSITTARALVRQLERLRAAAWELAEQRLPGVVERLGHGEKVDVSVEAPPLQFGTDEIGQVGRAFNAVQETAIRTAVEQAELRRGIRDVLLSLARRTQTLVHRQLTMLDTMERRRDIEVKELEELFRLDHLATRMRRNAENLIVLSGALPARGWRSSVPMIDVVRAAVGEVEDYTRVTVLPFGPVELAGRAVGDVTHLLAELIENAVTFSPPDTVVQVGGHLVANGFAIDIEDRGLGMTDEKLAEINERIENPPDFNLQSSVQLGLFVVSKLAERYGLRVSLKRSAYGGTTAVVVIPKELVVEDSDRVRVPATAAATTRNGLEVRRPTAVGAGRSAGTGGTATLTAGGTGPQQQPSGPALVAVPAPASEPPAAEPPAHAPAATGGDPEPGLPDGQDAPPADEPRSHDGDPSTPSGAGGGHPDPSQPEDQPPVPDISTTPSGLPVRVPQANLAEPLRTDEPVVAAEPDEPDDPGRSPEEIQRIMGSYQRGTRQGRSDAAEALGNRAAEGEEGQ
ncbi:sensor histidine kinase [Actinomadura opuntiae]|uniref:sensor histidine kinase n=1 Tax=Actinomadura sp. OS1-43 TaxID=604315 RepID=UPI00255B0689|nr:nitrate- and nitrite sensing domain-containing protein [Actinomadura sp. OS1-43]MDL4821233.1 nitrate- and nitrite sensing domain-containing protein [Actinomadura sp. OS1-43]